jgi:hypothetical protein
LVLSLQDVKRVSYCLFGHSLCEITQNNDRLLEIDHLIQTSAPSAASSATRRLPRRPSSDLLRHFTHQCLAPPAAPTTTTRSSTGPTRCPRRPRSPSPAATPSREVSISADTNAGAALCTSSQGSRRAGE